MEITGESKNRERKEKRKGKRREGKRERGGDPDPNPRDEKTWLVDQSTEGRKFRYEDRRLLLLCIFDTSLFLSIIPGG